MFNLLNHLTSEQPLNSFFRSDGEARGSNVEIILIGGGTAEFTDRPTILGADYPYTPIYKEIATFTIPGF